MGHSSIQVTVDTYAHLIPGGNIAWVDALDEQTSLQQNATPAQQGKGRQIIKVRQVIEKNGAGERNRTSDLRFTKPLLYRLSYAGVTAKDQNAHPANSASPPNLRVSTFERRIERRTRSAN